MIVAIKQKLPFRGVFELWLKKEYTMSHKLKIERISFQNPLPGLVSHCMCRVLVTYDGQRQLIVGIGQTEEWALDEVADKMAMKFSIKKRDLLSVLRPIALGVEQLAFVSGDEEGYDIPF